VDISKWLNTDSQHSPTLPKKKGNNNKNSFQGEWPKESPGTQQERDENLVRHGDLR
jgi:hypothetical protein